MSKNILAAAAIAARGIDVTQITHVINFTNTVDAYTHRIGRSARVDQTAKAFTFVAEADSQMARAIEKVLGAQKLYCPFKSPARPGCKLAQPHPNKQRV